MKNRRKMRSRVFALVLAAILLVDPNSIVFAEAVQESAGKLYSEYQSQKKLNDSIENVQNTVIPNSSDKNEVQIKNSETEKADEVPDTEVSLRLPTPSNQEDKTEAQLRSQYGNPVHIDENEMVFKVDSTHYVTLLGSTETTYQTEDGKTKQANLSLIPKDGVTGKERKSVSEKEIRNPNENIIYTPKDSNLDISLPANVSDKRGISIEDQSGDYRLELFPKEGNYGNATISGNALLYNSVQKGIDAQYTVDTTGIKEDIILQQWSGVHQFQYTFDATGYDVKQNDRDILIYKKGTEQLLFVLSAPKMTDASGEESQEIALSFQMQKEICTVTVDAASNWLADEKRVYPVSIDPTITVPTSKLIEVTTSTVHGTYQGTGYGYAGYISGRMTGVPRARDIGKSRMYFAIKYDFAANIPKEARIDSAKLKVYQYIDYRQSNATFACYRIGTAWNPETLTWDNSTRLSLQPAGENSVSPHKKGMHEFDIRDSVNAWVQGLDRNHGLVVMATDESSYGGAFYTPYSTGGAGQTDFTPDKRPSIVINWSVPDPVDVNYGLNNTTVQLRPMNSTDKEGKLQFQGVFADGLAQPGTLVNYALSDSNKNYSGSSLASFSYRYPDSSPFQSVFENGTTKYKDKLSNWQTAHPFTNPDFNVLYHITGQASKGNSRGEKKESDTFVIYKVTQFDTLPKIASYYGVPLSQIMFDNRVQDMLLVENNTLFIRNPKKNATTPYNPPALDDSQKAKIDSQLMGRGLHCEFGFEPINVNTGNFYLNRTDVSIPDYSGEFQIERNYNSKGVKYNSAFGRGWSFAYSEQLSKDSSGNLRYKRDDGSILVFTENHGTYTAPTGYDLHLEKRKIQEKSYDFGNGEEAYPVYEYLITDEDHTTKTFNSFGILTSVTDEKGNKTALSYNENQLLTAITSPAGKVFKIKSDEQGYINEVELPNGGKLKYQYDDRNNLTTFTDANGYVTKYEYDNNHLMTAWYDGNGSLIVKNEYDQEGRVIKQTDGNAAVSTLAYSDHQTVTTDGNGNNTTYKYDDLFRTVEISYPDGTSRSMSYTSDNRLASEMDELGHKTTHSYDDRGNQIQETRFDGKSRAWTYDEKDHVLTVTGFDGIVTSYAYDQFGNLISIDVDGKRQATYSADAQGRILSSEDANGNVTKYTYSGADLVLIQNAAGNETKLAYNAHGLPLTVTNALGGITKYTYDLEGRKTSETTPEGVHTGYELDGGGNVVSMTDGNGNTIRFVYDSMGRKIRLENENGGTYSYTYDANGNQTSITDAEGNKTVYAYDSRNRQISETDAAGDVIRYTYDAIGNKLTETDENGATTVTTYDYTTNTVSSLKDSLGNTVTYKLDVNGNPLEILYPDGTNEEYKYDSLGRTIQFKDEGGLVTTYKLDANGNVISENAGGLITKRTYDFDNRVLTQELPGKVSIAFSYDALGHLTQSVDGNGKVTKYAYDSEEKLRSLTEPNGNTTKYEYDSNGNESAVIDAAGNKEETTYGKFNLPVTMTDALGGKTTYAYDQMERIVSITDALGGATKYTYNKKGLPASVTDANGNTYSLTYTSVGNYDTITAPDGSSVSYGYNKAGQVIKETRSNGLITEYEYDAKGRVIHEWDNHGSDDTYTYDAYGNQTSITNAIGEKRTFVYDEYQRMISESDAEGNQTKYEYDDAGNLITETDPEGNTINYSYDGNGNLLTKKDGKNRVWKYTYDSVNQVLTESNPKQEVTSYKYDVLGNLTSVTDPKGITLSYGYNALSLPVIQTDGNGNKTLVHYDALGRIVKVTAADGGEETYTYDAVGNELTATDADGNVTTKAYDSMNRLISQKMPTGGVYRYNYDAGGAISKETDPLGNETTYKNNLHGQVVSKLLPNGAEYTYSYDKVDRIIKVSAPNNQSRRYSYDKRGNIIQETDQSERTTRYTYDVMNRMTGVENPLGLKTSFSYDSYGNLTSIVSPKGRKVSYHYDVLDRLVKKVDPSGRTIGYTYDKSGNLSETTVNGTHKTQYSYDKNGNLTSFKNALGEVTKRGYDSVNRLTTEENALGAKTTYAYTKGGLLASITDAKGGKTTFAYDKNGNQTGITDAEGRTVSYTYDAMDRITLASTGNVSNHYTYDKVGNLESVTDGNGNKTTYTYDKLSNIISSENALGEKTQWYYNAENNLSKLVQPSGKWIAYDYNKLDNLLQKKYSETANGTVKYTYDQDENRLSMSDLTGTTTYEYDEDNRIIGVRQGDGSLIKYEYDDFGNISKLIYPDKAEVLYEYDALDRLTKVTDRDKKETTYTYDAAGNLTEVHRANQTSAKLSYDVLGRITSVKNLDGNGSEISNYSYTYDTAGFILSETIKDNQGTVIYSYGYDQAGQLSYEKAEDKKGNTIQERGYAYDHAGNRIGITKDTAGFLKRLRRSALDDTSKQWEEKYTYDAVGRLQKRSTNEGDTSYVYDADGNRIREIGPEEKEITFAYDTENRLMAVKDQKGLLLAALYDGDSNRVFTARRTTDTKQYQLFKKPEKATDTSKSGRQSPKTSTGGEEASIFWYGAGGNFLQALTVAKNEVGSFWKGIYDDLVSAWHRKIVKDRADAEGIVVNSGGTAEMPGEGPVSYPSEISAALVPYDVLEDTYDYYEARSYINDVNREHTQVLEAYDGNGKTKEKYTYGDERLDYSDGKDTWYYNYTGTGSVAGLTDKKGESVSSYRYDTSGHASISGLQTENPFTYRGEDTDQETGYQYLRARYYDPMSGSFLTEDTYLGSLMEPLSQNHYTYAENNAVNFSDPSGHGIFGLVKSIWSSTKRTVGRVASSVVSSGKKIISAGINFGKRIFSGGTKVAAKAYHRVASGVKRVGNVLKRGYNAVKKYVTATPAERRRMRQNAVRHVKNYVKKHYPTAYEKIKKTTNRVYNWGKARVKEAKNLWGKVSKSAKNTYHKFCTTANRVKKKVVKFLKNVNWKKVGIVVGATLVTVGVGIFTGGAGFAAAGAVGLAPGSFGAAVFSGAVTGAIGGATYSGTESALSGNSADEVLSDTLKGGGTGFIFGGALGAIGHGIRGAGSKVVEVDRDHLVNMASKDLRDKINIKLKYKPEWTAAQRAEADAKVKALTEAVTVKTEVHRTSSSSRKMFIRAFGKDSVTSMQDIDHIVDLQLGGENVLSNLAPLDRSVNRSLGAQIKNLIKDYEYGTEFGVFSIE